MCNDKCTSFLKIQHHNGTVIQDIVDLVHEVIFNLSKCLYIRIKSKLIMSIIMSTKSNTVKVQFLTGGTIYLI